MFSTLVISLFAACFQVTEATPGPAQTVKKNQHQHSNLLTSATETQSPRRHQSVGAISTPSGLQRARSKFVLRFARDSELCRHNGKQIPGRQLQLSFLWMLDGGMFSSVQTQSFVFMQRMMAFRAQMSQLPLHERRCSLWSA